MEPIKVYANIQQYWIPGEDREASLPHISGQDKKRFIKMIYKWVKYSTILDSRREDIENLPYHTFLIKIKRDL